MQAERKRTALAGSVAIGAALVLLPLMLDEFALHLAVMTGIFMLLSVSLNLLSGNTGIVSLGHAAFFAIGAYTSAILTKAQVPFLLAMLAGAALSALCGLLLAFPALRVTGIYLKVITIAAGLIAHVLISNLDITGGVSGIMNIPRPSLFDFRFNTTERYYYLVLFFLVLVVGLVVLIERSYLGRALKALREDETAAGSLGISPTSFKMMAFVLSAAFAAVAGSLYAHYSRFIGPDSFTIGLSIRVLVMIVIGGMGSVWGSVVGTLVIYLLPEMLRFLNDYYVFVYGLLLTLMALFMPGGLVAALSGLRHRKSAGTTATGGRSA